MPVVNGRLTCCQCGADLGDAEDQSRDPDCVVCLNREHAEELEAEEQESQHDDKVEIQPAVLRTYECEVCGHEAQIRTNHTGTASHYCEGCSWKGVGFGPGHHISALGACLYRVFKLKEAE